MDGLRHDTEHQPGLEVAAPRATPPYYEPPPIKGDHPYHDQHDGDPEGNAPDRDSRICGMPKRTFWIVFLIVIVVIGAAIGGGVGGGLASRNNSPAPPSPVTTSATSSSLTLISSTTSSTSASTATPTTVPSQDIPPGVYRLVNFASSTTLDLSNGATANNSVVQGWRLNAPSRNQAWSIAATPGETGIYNIVHDVAKSFVTAPMGLNATRDPLQNATLARVYASSPGNAKNQYSQFRVARYTDGLISFRSVAYPSKMLDMYLGDDSNGNGVVVWTAQDGRTQRWSITQFL